MIVLFIPKYICLIFDISEQIKQKGRSNIDERIIGRKSMLTKEKSIEPIIKIETFTRLSLVKSIIQANKSTIAYTK